MAIHDDRIVVRKFNPLKNEWLKRERGASFDEVTVLGVLLDSRKHPIHEDQWLEFYYYRQYVWVVVNGRDPERFITMYKSRKAQREFGHGEKE